MSTWKSGEQCEPGLIAACLQGTFGLMMLTVRKHVPAAPFRKGIHTLVLVMQEHRVWKAVATANKLRVTSLREGVRERERKRKAIHTHPRFSFSLHSSAN